MKLQWRAWHTAFQSAVIAVVITALLTTNTLNVWLSSGLSVFLLASTFCRLALGHLKNRVPPAVTVRVILIGPVLGAVLCGIGSIQVGGPLGWLGVFLCLRLGLWPLRALYRLSVRGDGSTVFDYERESHWLISLYVVAPLLFIVFGLAFIGLWHR